MIDKLLFAVTPFSALGCGLVAGAFFAFSTFVMNALARLQPAQGIAAMQSISDFPATAKGRLSWTASPRHLANSSLEISL